MTGIQDRVRWTAVELWWGDERFLPQGHPDRNETQARQALLDRIPLAPARVHPMPGPDGPWGADITAAAAHHAAALAVAAGSGNGPDQARPPTPTPGGTSRHPRPLAVPAFDVVLLGVGPDAHVASLFPGRAPEPPGATVIGVSDSPKPPPERLSLTMAALNQAAEVWLLASGAAKAEAVRAAFGTVDEIAVPASAARGRVRTRWFLDDAAAAGLS
jgi:6-phosphogluconolactonase